MEIKFYYNVSDNRCINKVLLDEHVLNGNIKEETSIINPTLTIKSSSPIIYNYLYIEKFRRYYYITNVTNVGNDLWSIDLKVDVLMSFRGDIVNFEVVANKQTSKQYSDEYIDDGSLVTNSKTFTRVFNFPNGFNESGKYILITAG